MASYKIPVIPGDDSGPEVMESTIKILERDAKQLRDFGRIAQGLGWYAEGPIENGDQVQAAIKRAPQVIKKEGRPALVDAVTRH